MKRTLLILAAATTMFGAAPAAAQRAGTFVIVNSTGHDITSLTIRRFGTEAWRPLTVAAAPGARTTVEFSDPDCAFDIQATLAGGLTASWSGVNLCDVKVVALNRNERGIVWVDYE